MNTLDILVKYMDPKPIYNEAFNVANEFLWLSGTLLFFSVLFRAVKEQYNAASGQNVDFAAVFMDIFLWGAILICYFYLMALFVQLFNAVTSWLAVNGSLHTIALEIDQLTTAFGKMKPIEADKNSFAKMVDIVSTGLGYVAYATAYFCYILSFLIVLAVSSFLHLAHAFFFAIIVFWGLLVIPLQITNTIKLLRPFGLALGIILMWPVFELIIMYFFKFLFINGSAEMINSIGNTYTIGDEATFYMAFTVMNCLILAIVTSVPFFTMALIQGTGLPGAIMSFALAGGAAGVAMFKSVAGPVTNAAKGGGDLFGSIPGTNKSGAATNFKSAMDGMSDSFGKTSMFDAVSNMQSDMDGLSTNNDSAGATSASPTSADDAMQAGSPSGGSSSVGTDSSGASFNSQTSSDEQELAEAGNDVGTNDSGVNKGKKAKHTKQAKRGAVINYDKTHNTQ